MTSTNQTNGSIVLDPLHSYPTQDDEVMLVPGFGF